MQYYVFVECLNERKYDNFLNYTFKFGAKLNYVRKNIHRYELMTTKYMETFLKWNANVIGHNTEGIL